MICKNCGRDLPDYAIFCRYCGTQCAELPPSVKKKKKTKILVPLILVFLLIITAAAVIWGIHSKHNSGPMNEVPYELESANVDEEQPSTPSEEFPIEYSVKIIGNDHITEGDSTDLIAKLTPEGMIKRLVWTSSDENVAKVVNGKVSSIHAGETVIRVLIATEDGPIVEDAFVFKVDPIPISYQVKLAEPNMILSAGSSDAFEINVSANKDLDETIEYSVQWESSDSMVAAIVNDRIQAVGEGTATITATVSLPNGMEEKLYGTVTVNPAPPAQTYVPTQKPVVAEPSTASMPIPSSVPSTIVESAPVGASYITTEDYLISNVDTTYISIESLQNLTSQELLLARNEIFARHGRIFETTYIREYFEGKSWYSGTVNPAEFDPNVFNKFEVVNLSRIQTVENSRNEE